MVKQLPSFVDSPFPQCIVIIIISCSNSQADVSVESLVISQKFEKVFPNACKYIRKNITCRDGGLMQEVVLTTCRNLRQFLSYRNSATMSQRLDKKNGHKMTRSEVQIALRLSHIQKPVWYLICCVFSYSIRDKLKTYR